MVLNQKFLLLPILIIWGSYTAPACDIPVFRYAFDNWPADHFYATIFQDGPLPEQEKALLSDLEEHSISEDSLLNLQIETIDLSNANEGTPRLYEEAGSPETPALVLTYPGSSMNSGPVSTVPFHSDSVKALLDSPKRRELVSRLKAGESAVWIFLGSGDAEKDAEAFETLKTSLEDLEATLELPDFANDPLATTAMLDPEAEGRPPVRIDFSVLQLDRNDPAEALLVNLLLHSEPDLLSPDFEGEPMAFPIYGRGRVLYALIGKGINRDVIEEACQFLIGPCSCQVKDLNPGSTDLLLAANWGELGGDPVQGLQLGVANAVDGLVGKDEAPSEFSMNLIWILGLQGL
ncbi:MAG: hypothetical protein KC931_16670, partial [Candidatus Omnitrophica bacterium]|nr:hypothetical protein [Candidatus Omnitrophota bacterium]